MHENLTDRLAPERRCSGPAGLTETESHPDEIQSLPALHPESLLNIPLVRQLFDDPTVRIVQRGVDSRWAYAKIVSGRVDGYNPFHGSVFIGHHSHIAKWLPHAQESARAFNREDELVSEVLFAVHDYLHIWSYRWIAQLWPDLGFGTARITRRNFEDMVFCHLLSEAIATVGLDYWYLACTDLNSVAPIGTTQEGLTASYREAFLREYRRFHKDLDVQSPDFLGALTRFYCDGVFHGFSAEDMQLSPALRRWLVHELQYGKLQRVYCRQWFAHMADGSLDYEDEKKAGRPLRTDKPEYARLMKEMGDLLWMKVKQEDMCIPAYVFDPGALWAAGRKGAARYQFTNYNRCRPPAKAQLAKLGDTSMRYLLHQFIAGLDYDAFPREALNIFPAIYTHDDFLMGRTLLKDMKRVPLSPDEPRDLFLFN